MNSLSAYVWAKVALPATPQLGALALRHAPPAVSAGWWWALVGGWVAGGALLFLVLAVGLSYGPLKQWLRGEW